MEKHGGLILPHLRKKERGKKQENGRPPLKELVRHVQQQEVERISGRQILKAEYSLDLLQTRFVITNFKSTSALEFQSSSLSISKHILSSLFWDSVSVLSYCCCCSVAKLSSSLTNPMHCLTTGFSVPHHLLELAQVHVSCIADAIQPSHPLSFPSPPALNLSQHQGLFQWVSSSYQVPKVLELHLQHQYFSKSIQGWFPFRWTGLVSLISKGLS